MGALEEDISTCPIQRNLSSNNNINCCELWRSSRKLYGNWKSISRVVFSFFPFSYPFSGSVLCCLAVFGDSKHTAEHTANQCSIEVPLEWARQDRIKTSCPLVPCLGRRRRLLLLVEDPPRPGDSGIVCLLSCQSPRNKSNQCDCLLFCPPPVSQEPRQQQQQEIRTFATCCRYLATPPHVVPQSGRQETRHPHTTPDYNDEWGSCC